MKKPPEEYALELAEKYSIGKSFAETIVFNRLGKAFEEASASASPSLAAKWLCGDVLKCMNYTGNRLPGPVLVELIQKIHEKRISERLAKELVKKMFAEKKTVEEVLNEINTQESPEQAITQVIKANPKAVEDYRQGKKKAFEYLLGEVIKATKARADVKKAREILQKELE